MEKHARKLQLIFERLEQAKFKTHLEKCVFAADTFEYLGHISTPEGIRPDPKKSRAIEQYSVPSLYAISHPSLGQQDIREDMFGISQN
jgi:hypothetical protein